MTHICVSGTLVVIVYNFKICEKPVLVVNFLDESWYLHMRVCYRPKHLIVLLYTSTKKKKKGNSFISKIDIKINKKSWSRWIIFV